MARTKVVPTKVVSLFARPFRAAYLCFETDGVIADIVDPLYPGSFASLELGAKPLGVVLPALHSLLRSSQTAPGDPSRPLFDAAHLIEHISPFRLAWLQGAEVSLAALDRAVDARQNAYFSKHINPGDIFTKMNELYSEFSPDSKPNRLAALSDIAQQQATALYNAYMADTRPEVVTSTTSKVTSRSSSGGNTDQYGRSLQQTRDVDISHGSAPPPPGWMGEIPGPLPIEIYGKGGTPESPTSPSLATGDPFPRGWVGKVSADEIVSAESRLDRSNTKGWVNGCQTVKNTGFEYRLPQLECLAQNHRAQISLMDQQFAQFMFGQNLPYLVQVLGNELDSIDKYLGQLRMAVLASTIVNPLDGATVTGIYKSPGEWVRAGEPVIRVEDNRNVQLVARLVHRRLISVDPARTNVTITTTLFDASGPKKTTIKGQVVAARGRQVDEQWEVVIQCENSIDGGKTFILPIDYHFDYDNTQVIVG